MSTSPGMTNVGAAVSQLVMSAPVDEGLDDAAEASTLPVSAAVSMSARSVSVVAGEVFGESGGEFLDARRARFFVHRAVLEGGEVAVDGVLPSSRDMPRRLFLMSCPGISAASRAATERLSSQVVGVFEAWIRGVARSPTSWRATCMR